MLAFEIDINGNRYIVSGFEDWSTLSFDLLAIRDASDAEPAIQTRLGGTAQQIEPGKIEGVRWKTPDLKIGDTAKVRIVDVETADAPTKRYRSDKTIQESPFTDQEIEEMERDMYERLRAKFESDV